MFKLIVKQPFGGYAIGDEITSPAEVRSVLDSENEAHVVKTEAHDPAPARVAPTTGQ